MLVQSQNSSHSPLASLTPTQIPVHSHAGPTFLSHSQYSCLLPSCELFTLPPTCVQDFSLVPHKSGGGEGGGWVLRCRLPNCLVVGALTPANNYSQDAVLFFTLEEDAVLFFTLEERTVGLLVFPKFHEIPFNSIQFHSVAFWSRRHRY